jgi:hypothetical protein
MLNHSRQGPAAFARRNYANVAATLALVIALTGTTAMATVLVTSKQIRNGSILSQDIRKNAVKTSDIATNAVGSVDLKSDAVRTADIGTGQVESSDIGTGQVTPSDVTMPNPQQLQETGAATSEVGATFTLLDPVGTYVKQDPDSALEVDWTGTAAAGFSGCNFQLRVDGTPSANEAGTVFVANGGQAESIAATALFSGLPTGQHSIEIWARTTLGGGSYSCTVGPATAGIGQTIVVSELVL